jgi:hypothetical protein
MKTNSFRRKQDLRPAPPSKKQGTVHYPRIHRAGFYLLLLLVCASGSALAQSPAPYVIQGPTIVQNDCLPNACVSISYAAGSAITSNGRVVQANTGALEFDIPIVSNIPSTAALGVQVGFSVTATATGGAAGEVQANSARAVMTGTGSGTLKIPIPVEWAESQIRFQINYSMSGTKYVCIAKLGCKQVGVGYSYSTTGPNLSSIALGIPAPSTLDGVAQAAGSFPADAFVALVTPQVAFQLPLQPVGIVYGPVGNAGDAVSSLTFTKISGTNQLFATTSGTTDGLTQDDKTNYQAGLSFTFSGAGGSTVKLGFNFSGSWDNSVENDQQFSTTNSILTTTQQTSGLGIKNPPRAGQPPLNQVSYSTQPFWEDLILLVINAQYGVYSYPSKPVIQPIGNDALAGIVEIPIWQLDNCVNTPSALQPTSSAAQTWQPLHAYSVGALLAVENGYVQVATTAGVSGGAAPSWNTANGETTTDGSVTWTNESAHLIPINATSGVQYDWLTSTDCKSYASIDQFYVKKGQAASPFVAVSDLSFSGTDDTGVATTYTSQNAFSTTYSQSSTLTQTSKVSSVGTSSLGITADVSNFLQVLGINAGLGTTSTVTQTYTNLNTQSLQSQQAVQSILAASNTVHDNVNPPMELVVNALLDAYFGGIALQVPTMQFTPPPAAAIRPLAASPVSFAQEESLDSRVEGSVQETSPGYRIQKPEREVDPQVIWEAREEAAQRHSDEPLPDPEPGTFVMAPPAAR